VLPRIHRRVASDTRYLGALSLGLVLGAAAFILTASLVGKVLLLAVTAFFAGGVLPSYWSIAMKRLSGIQAAAGLAFINTVGLLGGFVGPYLFGMVEAATGRSESGFMVILIAGILGLLLVPLLAIAFARESGVAVKLAARA
jgi:MFS family permease